MTSHSSGVSLPAPGGDEKHRDLIQQLQGLHAAVFLHHLGQLLHPHLDFPALLGVFHGVGEEVDQNLVDPQLVRPQLFLRAGCWSSLPPSRTRQETFGL